MNTAQRKQMLIAQGALHRTEVLLSRESVRARLQPAALVKDAMPGMATAALTAWLGSGVTAGLAARLSDMLPWGLRAFGLLRAVRAAGFTGALGAASAARIFAGGKGWRARLQRVAVIGLVAGAAYLYLRRKQAD